MREYDDLPYIVIERHSGGVGPFLWGALLGAGVALLLAPRSGAETQDEIRRRVQGVRDLAEGRITETRDTITGAVTRTRNRIFDRVDTVRSTLEMQTARARDAMETGRRAAQRARTELERRMAEAKGERAEDGMTDLPIDEGEGRPELA